MKHVPPLLRRSWWTGERQLLLALAMLLVVVVLANDWAVLTPDTKPEIFLAPWRTAARFALPWLDSPSLGAPSFNVGVSPVAAVVGVLEAGMPPWLAMRVWRILLLLVAAWGARRLYRDLVDGSSADTAAGRVAVAVAYVANPYVVSGGGTTPTILPYALLPWFVLLTRRAMRDRSWATACLAALALAGTSGLNAGVVGLLQLVALVPLGAYVLAVDRVRLRHAAAAMLRIGAVAFGLSLYWLVPTFGAVAAGTTAAASTESIEAINVASSFAEVVRGLGLWTLYGGAAKLPFTPGHISYLTAPVVVLLTYLPVAFGAVGARMRARPVTFLGAGLLLTGALVMVGTFPDDGPSAWGRAVRTVLDDVPGAVAFRTTNKAGAVLELGVALLVAAACVEVARRVRRPSARCGPGCGRARHCCGGGRPGVVRGPLPGAARPARLLVGGGRLRQRVRQSGPGPRRSRRAPGRVLLGLHRSGRPRRQPLPAAERGPHHDPERQSLCRRSPG